MNARPVTDEDRRLAESKKLTLDPIHTRVVANDVSDEQIATNHLVNPPIANAPNDTEQNSRPIQPSAGSLHNQTKHAHATSTWQRTTPSVVILGMFILGGVATGIVFFLVQ